MELRNYVERTVGPFADDLLMQELVGLPPDRRRAAVRFTVDAVNELPSVMFLGVVCIATSVRAARAVPIVGPRLVGLLARHPLPLVGDYVRLIRSLGTARAYDEWPAEESEAARSLLTVG